MASWAPEPLSPLAQTAAGSWRCFLVSNPLWQYWQDFSWYQFLGSTSWVEVHLSLHFEYISIKINQKKTFAFQKCIESDIFLIWTGLCPVSKSSLGHLLSKSGKGNAVVIVIGGAAESLASSPGVNTVVVRQRKGFVRMALEFGWEAGLIYRGNSSPEPVDPLHEIHWRALWCSTGLIWCPFTHSGRMSSFSRSFSQMGAWVGGYRTCSKRPWVLPRVCSSVSAWRWCLSRFPSLLLVSLQFLCIL